MTVEQMVTKAAELIAKDARQHDADKARSIIEAGTVPEGYVVISNTNQVAKYEGGQINVYVAGALKRSIPAAAGTQDHERALIAYAVRASTYDYTTNMGRM